MHFVNGNQRLKLMAEYATSSINMRFRYHKVLRSLIIPTTLELSQFNVELTGKFWSEVEKLVRVKRFFMGQFD